MFNGLKIKTNSINLLSLVGGATIAAATLALTAGNASAGTLSFQVATQYGSTDVEYDVQIKDLTANAGVQISVNQSATSPNSADLLGLFFNLTPGNASNFGITSSSFTNNNSITSILPLSLAYIFLIIVIQGGVTGVVLGNNVLDLQLHDTYYMLYPFLIIVSSLIIKSKHGRLALHLDPQR